MPICCDSTKTMDNLDGLLIFGDNERFYAKEIERNSNLYKFLEALHLSELMCFSTNTKTTCENTYSNLYKFLALD